MPYTEKFSVPNYYPSFKCKGGDCSLTCCSGWIVTLSRDEYFHLASLSASNELRAKLDCTLCVFDHPTIEKYAAITFNYLGKCHLLDQNGLCSLQCECGEAPMTFACRYFPRSPKRTPSGGYECSCSCSCEAVLEALIKDRRPLDFEIATLTFDSERPPIPLIPPHLRRFTDFSDRIRKSCIAMISERSKPLSSRIREIGGYLMSLSLDGDALSEQIVAHSHSEASAVEPSFASYVHAVDTITDKLRQQSFHIEECSANYVALRQKYTDSSIDELNGIYRAALEHIAAAFPDFPILLEKILANHMYYTGFPFSEEHESLENCYASLVSIYCLLLSYTVAFAYTEPSLSEAELKHGVIALIAKAFRQFEGSNYYLKSVLLLKQLGFGKEKSIFEILI